MGELLHQLGIDWRLLISQAVNFGIVALVLTWFVFRPLLRIMDQRKQRIREGLELREQAAQEKTMASDERRRQLEQAKREAEELVNQAKVRAEEQARSIVQDARDQASRVTEQAKKEAEQERNSILRGSEQEISSLALAAAEKILQEKVGKEEERKIAEEVKVALEQYGK